MAQGSFGRGDMRGSQGRADQRQMELQFMVPDMVKQFVSYFYRHIRERNINEIWSMYDVSFNKLSERYFKTLPWPPAEAISRLVDDDHVFCLLYREMYYRHLYQRLMPSLEDRMGSWDNYCQLFQIILEAPINMQLPNGWLWDMVDEFCFQFHHFSHNRPQLARGPQDAELLASNPHLWHMNDVMGILKALTDRSGIRDMIAEDGGKALLETEGYSEHESNVLKMLGYYSMIGQLRCLTIIGEYEAALRALEPINIFDRKTLLAAKLTTCHITLFYYAGFCYLMLGRHVDAARCFNTIIGFISRVTSAGTQMRPVMYEEVLKKNEQLFSLLAVTVALCPRAIRFLDDPVANQLMAKHRETLSALTTAEGPDAVKDRFQEACPRFINPDMPNYTSQTELGRHNAAVASRQVAAFMEEVNRRKKVPAMRQCLSLYASIKLGKMAKLMSMSVEELKELLMGYKDMCQTMTWNEAAGSDLLGGENISTAEVEFNLQKDASGDDVVVVKEVAVTKRHAEVLARHVTRFQEIVSTLRNMRAIAAPPLVV